MITPSSPAWVEAAAINGRPAVAACSIASAAGSAGGAGTSSLRLPVVTTFDAPSSLKRAASDELPARQRSRRRSRSAIEFGRRRQRPNEFSDRRRVDQNHRYAARRYVDHHVWPKLGFHEQGEIRPPMIEKSAYEVWDIERNILMDHSARESLFGEPARGDGAGRYQHADAAGTDAID